MRTARLVLLAVIVVALAFVGCKKDTKAKWTILAYMDGNNNLDTLQNGSSWVIGDCQELEEVGSTDDVQIVAMVGSLRKGGNSKIYHIQKHLNEQPDQISSTVLEDLGGKDMSDKATLRDFVRKYVSQFPAERYMLIIDDHGGGWYGACEDNQNGSGDMMSMPEMREALKDTVKFDVIVFHACLMSMVEVAYELKDCANYMVACQFTMPMQSVLGSDKWLADLVANPDISPLDISKKIVDAVYQTAGEKQKDCHMAVTDLSKIQALAAKVKDLGNNIVTEVGDDWGEVLQAFNETHYTQYDHPAFVDLREYAKKIKQMPNLQNRNMIKTAADDVIAAINDAVPLTKTNVTAIPRGGLCIHFPYKTELFDSVKYVKLQFASWNWQNFLSKFIALAGGGGGGGGGDKGWLSVNSTPQGAAIWVNGSNTGAQTPAVFRADPATYQLKLTLTGYLDWEQNVTVRVGETTYVNAQLQQQGGGGDKGWLSINSTPQGATVWVNGANTGYRTPVILEGPPNSYQIKLTLTGYLDWEQSATIRANETTYINAQLQQQGGGGAATVTGTVRWQGGGNPSPRTWVFIDTVDNQGYVHPIAQAQVNPANGNYSVQVNITSPRQVVAEAWDDANGNSQPDAGDGWGFYDPDGNQQWTVADMFTISPGQTTSNINITLYQQDTPSRRRLSR
ncbi:MAG: clostripain-related cysteine peptidase [candidate division WOR-3 bacterium]